MVNASNPVKSLTEEQLQSVYSGETTNWKDLGGEDAEIVAFQRKTASLYRGTVRLFDAEIRKSGNHDV